MRTRPHDVRYIVVKVKDVLMYVGYLQDRPLEVTKLSYRIYEVIITR